MSRHGPSRSPHQTVLARVRESVAAQGFDPAGVVDLHRPGVTFTYNTDLVPQEVAWRARETAEVGDPFCCRCQAEAAAGLLDDTELCVADRRFVEDCGRDRGEP